MRFLFLDLAAALFVIWVGAFIMFQVESALIHLLAVFALVFLLIHICSRAPMMTQ